MILPAFGAAVRSIPAFSRKPLVRYTRWWVRQPPRLRFCHSWSWAHHMFTVGIPLTGELFFMYATLC